MSTKITPAEVLERTKARFGTYRDAAIAISAIVGERVHGNYFTMLKQRGFTKMAIIFLAALEVAGYKIVKVDE